MQEEIMCGVCIVVLCVFLALLFFVSFVSNVCDKSMEVWHQSLYTEMQTKLVDDEKNELFMQYLLAQLENALNP